MNLLEAIDARKSRRTYFNIPIEKEKAAILQDLITTFNVESTLTMTFIEDAREAFNSIGKSYGMFKGVCSVMVMKGLKADFHLKEKVGYYGERLILEATCLKLGTCWVGATFDKNNILFAVPEEEELICVIPVGCV
ncbi:MAG: nitroreductase family protein, partial [Bacteroidales bacterium]